MRLVDIIFYECLNRSFQVQFDILKSHYFLSCGNASSALDWARRAREIAEECGFTKELISLNDHIQMRVPTIFTDGRCDGVNLLNIAREIETTTDGHAESAASEVTDFALFSDDSEWDNSGYVSYVTILTVPCSNVTCVDNLVGANIHIFVFTEHKINEFKIRIINIASP